MVGQKHVGFAVEQHQDRATLEPTGTLFLTKRQTGRTTTHVAYLKVEDDQIGVDLSGGSHDLGAGPHAVDQMGPSDGGLDLVENPVGVGGQEYVRHGSDRTRGPIGGHGRVSEVLCRYDAAVLEIIVEKIADRNYVVLRPEGELDAYSVAQFREAFAGISDEPRLVVDLAQVQFIDSAGLGALIGGIRKSRENEGRIAVFCDRANINRLLHTTGFNRIVPVKETMEEAVVALDDEPS